MALIGFVVNPIAGMGGRVGLKGTDGTVEEARRRGAEPVAPGRALAMLRELKRCLQREGGSAPVEWITSPGPMGAEVLAQAGFTGVRILSGVPGPTSAEQTTAAAAAFLDAAVALILFCGGDGTARDIASVIGQRVPLLGIPSGVKMYSGVFGATPERTAGILVRFLKDELQLAEAEVLDLDEERYRAGEWVVRLHQSVLTPLEPTYTQSSKQIIADASEAEAKADIAAGLREIMAAEPETLFILGPGSTVEAVAWELGLSKSLLGIDALLGQRLLGEDMSEQEILSLLTLYPRAKLVLSPIGAQGFVLGRGNLQLSPTALRRIGGANIIVIATPAKIDRTPVLRFDTGDTALDAELAASGHLPVIIGYHRLRLVKVVV